MLHKNYHDTACITGFVFKTKYLRGWKSKDKRGEIETKTKKAGVTILICIKEESEIKKILKGQRKMFYCGKKSR